MGWPDVMIFDPFCVWIRFDIGIKGLPSLVFEPHPLMTSDSHPVHPFLAMQRIDLTESTYCNTLLKTLLVWRDTLIKNLHTHLEQKANALRAKEQKAQAAQAMADAQNGLTNVPSTTTTLTAAQLDQIRIPPEDWRDDMYIALQWFTYYHIQQHLAGASTTLQLPMLEELLHYSHLYYEKFATNIKVGQRIDLIYNQTHFSPIELPHTNPQIPLGSGLWPHPIFSMPGVIQGQGQPSSGVITTAPDGTTTTTTITTPAIQIQAPHPSASLPRTHPHHFQPSGTISNTSTTATATTPITSLDQHPYFFRFGQYGKHLQPCVMSMQQQAPMYYHPEAPLESLSQLFTNNTLQMLPNPTMAHNGNVVGINNNMEQLISTYRQTMDSSAALVGFG